MELLELLRRRARCSPGSDGRRPDDFANMFRMSVSEMTPVRRPERWAPGMAAAGTTLCTWVGRGDCGTEPEPGTSTVEVVGANKGVAGADGDGDADSTTHIR